MEVLPGKRDRSVLRTSESEDLMKSREVVPFLCIAALLLLLLLALLSIFDVMILDLDL